jgi:hypothetical protein
MLLVSTLQGIATLVAAGRLPAEQIDDLIADTTTLFTRPAQTCCRTAWATAIIMSMTY